MDIAIIGAGPIGLEAALAAEEIGHTATVFEAGRVGEAVAKWGHVQLFTPWPMNTTARGRARIGKNLGDECPTGAQLVERYLKPLSAALQVREHHRLIGASRGPIRKPQEIGGGRREHTPFRLLFDTPAGEIAIEADALFDCSGVLACPNPAGPGGLPAVGERAGAAAGRVFYGLPRPESLPPGPVAVIGAGASGCTLVTQLLAAERAITWLTGADAPAFPSPPDDRLPERRSLWLAASEARERVNWLPETSIVRIVPGEDGLLLHLDGGREIEVAALLVATGFRPDLSMTRELQVHYCYASEGPMKLAAALLAASGAGGDCLDQGSQGAATLLSPEPRLFVLGSKSYGRRNDFLLQTGYRQVEEALSLLR